jgi:MoaA/NifB/PqqE/SkfB family radical SAM enzyme
MRDVGRPWTQLSLELFKKIADDMCEFPESVQVLRLYKDGEPLLNRHLPEMISYAKQVRASKRVDTTTNASLLSERKGRAIVDAGLDRINISIYGVTSDHYKTFSGVQIEFEKVLNNVRNFYEYRGNCEMLVKVSGDSLSLEEQKAFLDYFGDYTDKIHIEHTMSCWPEFQLRGVSANEDFGIYGQPIREVDTCPYPFYSFSINSDGLVSVCFLDWGRKMVVGDANQESLVKIWDGRLMRAYRKMFLSGDRKKHSVCGTCGQMTHGMPDDIDSYRQDILANLTRSGYFTDVPDLTSTPTSQHVAFLNSPTVRRVRS